MVRDSQFPFYRFSAQATRQYVGYQPTHHFSARMQPFDVVAVETSVVDDKGLDGAK